MTLQTFKQFYSQILLEDQVDSWLERYPPYKTERENANSELNVTFNTTGVDIKDFPEFEIDFYETFLSDLKILEVSFMGYDKERGYHTSSQIDQNDQVKSIRIFTTVISEILNYMTPNKSNTIDVIKYTASMSEQSRVKLYNTMSPLLADKLNRIYFTTEEKDLRIHTYALIKNDAKIINTWNKYQDLDNQESDLL